MLLPHPITMADITGGGRLTSTSLCSHTPVSAEVDCHRGQP